MYPFAIQLLYYIAAKGTLLEDVALNRVLEELPEREVWPATVCWQRDDASSVSDVFPSSKERLRFRLYGLLVALDIFAISSAFVIGNILRLDTAFHPQGREMLVVLLPIFLALAANNRAYSIDALNRPQTGIVRALQALLIGFAVVMGILFYMKVGESYSRVALAIGTAGSIVLMASSRHLVGQFIGKLYKWSFVNEVVLVDSVTILPRQGEIVIIAEKEGLRPTMNDPMMLDRVGRLLRYCDRVILACPPERRVVWARMLKGMDVDAEVIAPELDEVGAMEMRSTHGKSTLLISCGPLGFRSRVIKRAFDLAITLPAIILLGPLMLLVAIAIVSETRGPVFFRQARVGRGNRIFNVLKFRSMRAEAEDPHGRRSTGRADDRITRVGRIIRATSIDELPQLFNVLRGEMSVVGPRPHALASTAGERLFWAVDERYLERHIVKPGITGLAQVRGFRGATLTENDLIQRLQADLDYLSGWSIWRDCKILIDTLRVVVHHNAY